MDTLLGLVALSSATTVWLLLALSRAMTALRLAVAAIEETLKDLQQNNHDPALQGVIEQLGQMHTTLTSVCQLAAHAIYDPNP